MILTSKNVLRDNNRPPVKIIFLPRRRPYILPPIKTLASITTISKHSVTERDANNGIPYANPIKRNVVKPKINAVPREVKEIATKIKQVRAEKVPIKRASMDYQSKNVGQYSRPILTDQYKQDYPSISKKNISSSHRQSKQNFSPSQLRIDTTELTEESFSPHSSATLIMRNNYNTHTDNYENCLCQSSECVSVQESEQYNSGALSPGLRIPNNTPINFVVQWSSELDAHHNQALYNSNCKSTVDSIQTLTKVNLGYNLGLRKVRKTPRQTKKVHYKSSDFLSSKATLSPLSYEPLGLTKHQSLDSESYDQLTLGGPCYSDDYSASYLHPPGNQFISRLPVNMKGKQFRSLAPIVSEYLHSNDDEAVSPLSSLGLERSHRMKGFLLEREPPLLNPSPPSEQSHRLTSPSNALVPRTELSWKSKRVNKDGCLSYKQVVLPRVTYDKSSDDDETYSDNFSCASSLSSAQFKKGLTTKNGMV